jgi:hypothetical protein
VVYRLSTIRRGVHVKDIIKVNMSVSQTFFGGGSGVSRANAKSDLDNMLATVATVRLNLVTGEE